MGNSCCSIICPHLEKDNFEYFRPGTYWVRELEFSEGKCHTLYEETDKSKEIKCWIIYHKFDESKGVICTASSFYEGSIEEKMAHGNGTEKFRLEGDEIGIYSGSFEKNARHGEGFYEDNEITFQGEWSRGSPKKGTMTIRQNNMIKENQPKEEYIIENINFDSVLMDTARIKMTLPDGSKYDGQIKRRKPNSFDYVLEGNGNLKMKNGDQFCGDFKNGSFFYGIYTWKKLNKKYHGSYKDGIKHGEGRLYLSESLCISGEWKNGKKKGEFYIISINNSSNNEKNEKIEKKVRFEGENEMMCTIVECESIVEKPNELAAKVVDS